MKLLAITVSAALLFAAGASHAQLGAPAPLPQVAKIQGPTQEETTAWIMNKINTMPAVVRNKNDSGEPVDGDSEITRVFIDGCKIMTASSQNGGRIYSDSGPIEELDADNFKIRSYGYNDRTPLARLGIRTIGERKVFQRPVFAFSADISDPNLPRKITQNINAQFGFGQTKPNTPVNISGTGWAMPDMETAQSVGNAFKHLAMLCRQKVTDEKAAIPVRKKDLF